MDMIWRNSNYIGICNPAKRGDGESASAIVRKVNSKIKLTVDPVNIGKPFSQTSMSSDFMIP